MILLRIIIEHPVQPRSFDHRSKLVCRDVVNLNLLCYKPRIEATAHTYLDKASKHIRLRDNLSANDTH